MRISWLEPDMVRAAREALLSRHATWEAHFHPRFEPPPAPDGVVQERWPRVVEHVARAERVSAVLRERGLEPAIREFSDSGHAIERATLVAAAVQVEKVSYELVASVIRCDVDELVVYGPFLTMLIELARDEQRDKALVLYERFCAELEQMDCSEPMWSDRVGAVRDGLASLYVAFGHEQQGQELFERRHREETGDLVVALAASRTFLSAGVTGRAIQWLLIGAERADELGRSSMGDRLRQKAENLRSRLS